MAENVDLKTYITNLATSGPETIRIYSERLRQTPYYRGKAVDKLTPSLLKGIEAMEEARVSLRQFRGDIDRTEFLAESIATGEATGGPTTRKSFTISDDTAIAAIVDEIIQSEKGRMATPKERAFYIKKVRNKQKKSPVVTTYSAGGEVSTTTGGVNEGQYLLDLISKDDEAKANKVLKGYDILLNELGGLR